MAPEEANSNLEITSAGRARHLKLRLCIFIAIVLLGGYRFYRLRNYAEFIDESVETTTGWLLSEGETIYGSVFSHHMPLAALLSQIVAFVSPTDRAAHFRIIPWLGYVLAAWALARSPFEREKHSWGFAAALCFLFLTTLVAPLVSGQMVLNDTLWGIAFTVFFLRFLLPFLLGMRLSRSDAVVGGVALVLAASGSLISFYPIAVSALVVLIAFSSKETRRSGVPAFRAFALAAAGTVLALFVWLLAFGRPRGFVEQAIRFNFDIYAKYSPEQSGFVRLVTSTLATWRHDLAGAPAAVGRLEGEALFAPVFVADAGYLAFLVWRHRRREGSGTLVAMLSIALVLLVVVFLRMRGGGFRSFPLYVFLCGVLSVLLGQLWAYRQRVACAAVGAILIGPFLVAAKNDESFDWNTADRAKVIGVWRQVADHLEKNTSSAERIAAFPTLPLIYLESKRHPAVDSVYYLPWQAEWESKTNRHPNTCEQLQAARPRFVCIFPVVIWSKYPWADYAPCIDTWVRANYRPVEPERFGGSLWERLDRRD